MNWRPSADVDTARARAAMLDRVRNFFACRNVLEVTTPVVTGEANTDPNIESLVVLDGGTRLGWLRTSPEHHMKRMLAAGYPDIYQVGPVGRGSESGRLHLPEFTMVEWYRLGFSLAEIMAETVELIAELAPRIGTMAASYVSYRELFMSELAIDSLDTNADQLADMMDAAATLREQLGNNLDAWLDLAIATRIAPGFNDESLTVVHHYPASQAALSRLSAADSRVAERFEVFAGPTELANGFVELTDAGQQRERFNAEVAARQAAGAATMAVDEKLLAALEHGLPDCAGVALGFDRLLMVDRQLDHISGSVSFEPG